ncbi:MAG: site-specific DNA-methyltransferase, partial [Acetobacteraceae bacterium]
ASLMVAAPPLYIQEKVHPKVIIDDLKRWSSSTARPREGGDPASKGNLDSRLRGNERRVDDGRAQPDLFADFNGLDLEAKTEFYQHSQNWSNRMISGDSLSVMASLAEREGLRGQVQCIYLDPPYGIKFNSNFQWSTTSRDVKDGAKDHVTREPEQVRAFRDTWRDGIHSYLTYLRDRLTVARDLLHESGSIFVQIGDENVHRVRAVLDEVFGGDTFVAEIVVEKTQGSTSDFVSGVTDFVLWTCKQKNSGKYRQLLFVKAIGEAGATGYTFAENADSLSVRGLTRFELDNPKSIPSCDRPLDGTPLVSQNGGENSRFPVTFQGKDFIPRAGFWKTSPTGFKRLIASNRIVNFGNRLEYKRFLDDYPVYPMNNIWLGTGERGFVGEKSYIVQTAAEVIKRCILMATDPGDLVLDPTCGSGTTAYVAEQWGRRWITIDTSRVALALARTRLMAARYPWYLLADSREGRAKEAELSRRIPPDTPTHNDLRQAAILILPKRGGFGCPIGASGLGRCLGWRARVSLDCNSRG